MLTTRHCNDGFSCASFVSRSPGPVLVHARCCGEAHAGLVYCYQSCSVGVVGRGTLQVGELVVVSWSGSGGKLQGLECSFTRAVFMLYAFCNQVWSSMQHVR